MYSHETSVYYAVLITALTIGCIIVYFILSLFRQQRKNIENRFAYFAADINLLEKDRSRVSRDLHDEMGTLLSVAQWHIHEVNAPLEEDKLHLEKATEMVEQMRRRLTEIAANLSPRSLTRKGLRFTLEHFFEDMKLVSGLQVVFTYEAGDVSDTEKGIHIYRIVQEITHNAIKHARAKQLVIHFKERKGKLYVYCKDDGIGFDAGEEKGHGSGLGNLQSRTELLKGKMTCTSKPGHGTEYLFELPG